MLPGEMNSFVMSHSVTFSKNQKMILTERERKQVERS